jgi:integrase/recombinase XerD
MINLSKSVNKYLWMRRQLGFELKNAERILNQFTAYMKQQKKFHITSELALAFATKNKRASLVWQAKMLSVIRRFAQHHRLFDPKTEIPSEDLLPCSYRRQQPYIYSDKEIKQLLKSCQHFTAKDSIHAWTYYAFFGLIAVTGMRTGEAISLSRGSVNLNLGIITILESKNQKSRKIPIHPSVTKTLKQYSKVRDQFLKKTACYFFVDDRGEKLQPGIVYHAFRKLCSLAGISKKGKLPRITDFRHTFAVKTLENCYSKGINPKKEIPALAQYLGHENPKHTYWYLTATPRLMKLVVKGLEKRFGGKK